jgi:hypothetical protein
MHLGVRLNHNESLHTEYKEFCLKLNIYDFYEFSEVEDIVTTGQFNQDFNMVIDMNIKNYFCNYIPKYASAFSNCKVDEECILHIGVNDFGEITGVPYKGELNEELLESYLTSACKNIRGEFKSEYTDKIKLELVKLNTRDVKTRLYDVSNDIINKLKEERGIYEIKYKNYLQQREDWMTEYTQYCCSINQLISGKGHEIANYMRKVAPEKTEIIEQLDERTPVLIENIDDCKDDEDQALYWIFKFKDEILESILRKKPRPPICPKICNAPYILMTQLSDMRRKFVEKNTDLNYYLIKVKFSSHIKNKKHLEYYHPYKRIWLNRKRVVDPIFGACCIAIPTS